MLFSSSLLIFQNGPFLDILMIPVLIRPRIVLEKSVLNRNYNPLSIDLMFGYSVYLTYFLLYHLNYFKFLHSYLNKYFPTLTSLYNTSVLVFFLSSGQINIKFCVHNQSG